MAGPVFGYVGFRIVSGAIVCVILWLTMHFKCHGDSRWAPWVAILVFFWGVGGMIPKQGQQWIAGDAAMESCFPFKIIEYQIDTLHWWPRARADYTGTNLLGKAQRMGKLETLKIHKANGRKTKSVGSYILCLTNTDHFWRTWMIRSKHMCDSLILWLSHN